MADPEGLGSLVGKVVGELGLAGVIAAGRLFEGWERIVGAEIAARSKPLSLRSGVLKIQTDSAAWANEVRYLAPELLRRANEALGGQVARELQVVYRPAGGEAPAARQPPGPEPAADRPVPRAPGARPRRGADLPISDPDLADAVARVLDVARATGRDNKGRKEGR